MRGVIFMLLTVSANQIAKFSIILVAVILYITAITMRSKNSRKNAYILELLSLFLIFAYQITTVPSITWNNINSVLNGLSFWLFLTFIVTALVSKIFFRRK